MKKYLQSIKSAVLFAANHLTIIQSIMLTVPGNRERNVCYSHVNTNWYMYTNMCKYVCICTCMKMVLLVIAVFIPSYSLIL